MMSADELRAALCCSNTRCACSRRRSRVTHCPAHDDRRPSLTIDERDGRILVHCHSGCRQAAVLDALRARGLWPSPTILDRARSRSPLEQARHDVIREGQRQQRRLDPWRELAAEEDSIRLGHRIVERARRVATELHPCARAWDLLAAAATLERETLTAEAALE